MLCKSIYNSFSHSGSICGRSNRCKYGGDNVITENPNIYNLMTDVREIAKAANAEPIISLAKYDLMYSLSKNRSNIIFEIFPPSFFYKIEPLLRTHLTNK